MPTARGALASAKPHGLVYALGGTLAGEGPDLATAEVYAPEQNLWQTIPEMNVARGFLGAAGLDGKVYAVGGLGAEEAILSSVEAYDPQTREWGREPSLPTGLYGPAVAAHDGRLYVAGGIDGEEEATGDLEIYDRRTQQWTAAPPMSTPRALASATFSHGDLYVIGDVEGEGGRLASVESYDPRTRPMRRSRSHAPIRRLVRSRTEKSSSPVGARSPISRSLTSSCTAPRKTDGGALTPLLQPSAGGLTGQVWHGDEFLVFGGYIGEHLEVSSFTEAAVVR